MGRAFTKFLLFAALIGGSIWAPSHWPERPWMPFLLAAVWYGSVPVFRKLGGKLDLYPTRHSVSAVLMFAGLLVGHFAGLSVHQTSMSRAGFLTGALICAALATLGSNAFLTKEGRASLRPGYRIDLGPDGERFNVEGFLGVGCLFLIWVTAGVLSIVFLGRAIFG